MPYDKATPRSVREAELAFYDAMSLYGHESAEALVAERFWKHLRRLLANRTWREQRRAERVAKPPLRPQTGETPKQSVVAFECTLIALTLDEHAGRIQETADVLVIPRRTLQEKMKKCGLDRNDFK